MDTAEQKCRKMKEELVALQADAAQAAQRLGVAEAFRLHLERQLISAQASDFSWMASPWSSADKAQSGNY